MKKLMLVLIALAIVVTLGVFLNACNSGGKSADSVSLMADVISHDSMVKRGAYLVNAVGCDHCHTPKKMGPNGPVPDLDQRFAGHLAGSPLGKPDTSVMKNGWMLFSLDLTAFNGPWGTSYAANISSDSTGIGQWTESQFLKAIREGKSKGLDGTRPLLPPMPWDTFRNLSDLDIKSIFAYLKSSKPIKNVVPPPKAPGQL